MTRIQHKVLPGAPITISVTYKNVLFELLTPKSMHMSTKKDESHGVCVLNTLKSLHMCTERIKITASAYDTM